MTEIPKLHVMVGPAGYHNGLAGWDEFNRYGVLNWPLWKDAMEQTSNMTEVDRLKMMLAAHAVELWHLKTKHAEYCARNPEREIQVDGKTYRYIGP